jgi:hypothetical protein
MPVKAASSEDALAFIRKLQEIRIMHPEDFEQRVMDIVRDTKLGTLQSIARRVMMDLAKGPPYIGGGFREESDATTRGAKTRGHRKKAAPRKNPTRGAGHS